MHEAQKTRPGIVPIGGEIPAPPVEPFPPFSIITSNMRSLDNNDAVYIEFRDRVAAILYDSEARDVVIGQRHRHVAARAIKSILELTRPRHQKQPWYEELVADAENNGFVIHVGKGVTFADPRQIKRTASSGRKRTHIYQALPNDKTILFARKHTRVV